MVSTAGQKRRQLRTSGTHPAVTLKHAGISPGVLAATAEAIQNLNSLLTGSPSTRVVQTVAYLAQAKVELF